MASVLIGKYQNIREKSISKERVSAAINAAATF